jgi:hypothetical protein
MTIRNDSESAAFETYITARENYRYVPGCLRRKPVDGKILPHLTWQDVLLYADCPDQAAWTEFRESLDRPRDDTAIHGGQRPGRKDGRTYSSVRLDSFHSGLLKTGKPADDLHALMSVTFWGYVSGTDNRIRIGRGIGKANVLAAGRRPSVQNPGVARRIDTPEAIRTIMGGTRELVGKGHYGDALLSARRMKYWGYSFASKLVMFMDPDCAVVYDSVIWQRLHDHPDPQLRAMAEVSITCHDPAGMHREAVGRQYQAWCNWCRSEAHKLNKAGKKWTDWDGTGRTWRAVDVERAFFSLGRTGPTLPVAG